MRRPRGFRRIGFLAALLLGPASLLASGGAREVPAAGQEAPPAAPAVDPARDAELDALTAEIGNTLRCPVCRQQSVTESSSQIAREMQALIRDKLEAGETPAQIEAYFVDAYGEWILLRPRARGVNLLVYLVPAVAFLLGGLWFAGWLRGRRRSAAAAARSPAPGDEAGGPSDDVGADAAGGLPAEDRAWLESAIRGV